MGHNIVPECLQHTCCPSCSMRITGGLVCAPVQWDPLSHAPSALLLPACDLPIDVGGLASSVRCRAVGPPAFPLSDSHQLPPAFAGTVQSRSATRLVVSRVSRCKAEAAALRAIVLERCLLAQRGGPCHATLMRPASCRPHLLILLDHHVLNLLLRQGLMSILG